jgi:protein-L-isoaspartate(D-aspartate) O-methyltransferase
VHRRPMRLPCFLLLALVPAALGFSQDWDRLRRAMVDEQIAARGVRDARVLEAMRGVQRHLFVPEELRAHAYDDSPLPIGEGQTISQPYIVALMTDSLGLSGGERVLEIGTGSGYQSAVLSRVAREVYTIEIRPALASRAASLLQSLGVRNVTGRSADGYDGWSEAAPFDCIMITAAVNHVPPALLDQLKEGGRMVLPLGNPFSYQELVLITRSGPVPRVRHITGVLFVPMTGKALAGSQ